MKISVIIPSFQQGPFIERTICSIVEQNYPNLELIVIDGGSNDGTVEILRRYEKHLAFWVSEKDLGQSHAINKGFSRATGEIVTWLNSDDKYSPSILYQVAKVFSDPSVIWVTGHCEVIDENDRILDRYQADLPKSVKQWLALFVLGHSLAFIQPSTFWRRQIFDTVGLLSEELHFSFDHEFFFRIFKQYGPPKLLDRPLSQFRLHGESKTSTGQERFVKENRKIAYMHCHGESLMNRLYLYGLRVRQIFQS